MEEVANISNMPDTVFKHFFTKKDRLFVNRAKECAYDTCHKKISEKYINASLNNFKKGIIYFSKGDVIGFVVWKEKLEEMPTSIQMLASMENERRNYKPEKYIEITLLCAKPNIYRLGSHILYDVNQYCLENKIELIELYPADADLIQFYNKNGYKINSTRAPRSSVNIIRMYKTVSPILVQKTNKTRKHRLAHVSRLSQNRKIKYYNTLLHEHLQNDHNYEILDKIFTSKSDTSNT
jgi:hypothetical protein